jgi:hypothetical protein
MATVSVSVIARLRRGEFLPLSFRPLPDTLLHLLLEDNPDCDTMGGADLERCNEEGAMDAEALKRWRGLHFRVACGETLSTDEEQFYRAGLSELEQGDPIGTSSAARLQQLRQAVATLEAERAELIERGRQLDLRIGTLEEALRERSRELLGKGD